MIYVDMFIYLQLCFLSVLMMVLSYKYFLLMLIIMELIVMSVVILMFTKFLHSNLEIIFILYLVFSVCESVLGMGILVMVIRYYGDDYYNLFNLNKF
ncbi:nad4l (mitochondrion) [Ooceraea biroi]|uniref:NADH-ubiquinone oxidoreductase chain 4L n=1 Tax=Ooceraea biroi TaxID=2015173 RepID=A0A3L8D3A8_OOCBI|nr:nad4l [Ooceraea biroi]